jgi:RNA polymerase sigma-70 factor (ECF subfamily)
MYNIAIRLLDNRMDAEDILQDAFVTAYQRLDELERPAAFPGWMKRIVINRCISLQRRNRLHFDELVEHTQVADEPETDDLLDRLPPERVHAAIKNLPPSCRTILVLHALEGYKHREVAAMLEVSESTSKTQYHRGLALMRKELLQTVDEP